MMNILITGSNGFIGRNLVEYFSSKTYKILTPKRIELDLTNADAVAEYFNQHPIDIILHCAMVTHNRETSLGKYAGDVVEKNLRMFFNLQRCMTKPMRMIHLGSGAEYSRLFWHHKICEDFFDRHIPEDSYGYAKYAISKYVQKCDNVTCLRIFGIFGKHEDYIYRFISNAIIKNLLRMPIIINQNAIYDYLYVADFARIMEYFALHEPEKNFYNITPSNSIDLLSIARIINDVSGYCSEIVVLNEGYGLECTGDNQSLLKEIGDFQFTKYEHAIKELFQYYSENMHTINIEAIRKDNYLEYIRQLNK